MFEKVLIPLDFSVHSQKILDHIGEIPGTEEVVLLHVVDATRPSRQGRAYEPHFENVKLLLAEKKESLEHLGLKVHIRLDVIANTITQGTVSEAILETAETEKVSLIILGARGINPIQELLLGSVSSFVLRHAKVNVLVFHSTPEREGAETVSGSSRRHLFAKVLVPTDFSKTAEEVLSLVRTLPGIKEMSFLHVVNRGESQPEIEVFVTEAQSRLEDIKKEVISAGVDVKIHVRVGDPTEMILSVADEDDVSLITMGAYGTNWLREILLGNTAFTVVRRAKRSVLVIRTGLENENR